MSIVVLILRTSSAAQSSGEYAIAASSNICPESGAHNLFECNGHVCLASFHMRWLMVQGWVVCSDGEPEQESEQE